jgi:hypothetical protein
LIIKFIISEISVNKMANPNGNVEKYIGGRNVTVGGRYDRNQSMELVSVAS